MIPICKPLIDEAEIKNVVEVLRSGMLACGEWVKRFEEEFAKFIGVKYAVATTSGTVALDIALKAIGIKSGDEVIVPDFTFIATANAVLFQNAKPVFADVDEKTFTIDPDDVLEKITPKTKAIIGVHLFGHPFDVKAIKEICEDHNLFLIEDCAQAHGAEYKGRKVGSFGDVSCFSFYATKNMTTGEGGMVLTNNREIERKLRLLINHGQEQKYLHTTLGYNYRMTNIQAAIGIAQLRKLEIFNERRIKNAEYLNKHLKVPLETPYKKKDVKHVYHQYVVKIKEDFPMSRDEFINYLSEKGIGSAVHYPLPIHKQPLYQKLGYPENLCPVATELSKVVLSLPVHPALTEKELRFICEVINSVVI
ncbi:MAG TPA: DegT/DnrJ/EryC1/StrS family aminotransferase [Candidatus Nanopusillus sp.]|nr:DegT/DnrJ/EryC1/StrS family aminotransferase [Candidatus Nanopusillus sp.]